MQELLAHLATKGFDYQHITFGGDYNRTDRAGTNSAWVVAHEITSPHYIIVATFGDWATGEKHTYRSDAAHTYTPDQAAAVQAAIAANQEKEKAETEKRREAAKHTARALFSGRGQVPQNHPYLTKKGLLSAEGYFHGTAKGKIIVPIYDITDCGQLSSVQIIRDDGGKEFLEHGKMTGCYSLLPGDDYISSAKAIILCEGYATAVSLKLAAPSASLVVCLNAGNLPKVARNLLDIFPKECRVLIAADNDHGTEARTGDNPGIRYASEAAKLLDDNGQTVKLIWPKDIKGTDFNDLHQERGLEAVEHAISTAFDSPLSADTRAPALPAPLTGGTSVSPPAYTCPTTLDEIRALRPAALPWPRDPKGKPIPPQQTEVAKALYDLLGANLIREAHDVFQWCGTHWVCLDADELHRTVRVLASRLMGGRAKDWELNAFHNLFLDTLDTLPVFSRPGESAKISFWMQPLHMVAFLDGTLEIHQEKLGAAYAPRFRESRREDYLTGVLPHRYLDPRPINPLFREWLDSAIPTDTTEGWSKRRALAQLGGGAILPRFPRIGFLWGVPGTGKSTFAGLVQAFIGEGLCARVAPEFLTQKSFLLSGVLNKRTNILTDINTDAPVDNGLLKLIEDPFAVQVNRKNQEHVFAFLPKVHIFCGQDLPAGLDPNSNAMDRRFSVVEFTHQFTKDGKHTPEYWNVILAAGSGDVLDWFLQGLADLCANGGVYHNPDSGATKMLEARQDSHPVGRFVQDLAEGVYPGYSIGEGTVKGGQLFALFKDANPRYDHGVRRFYHEMEKRGFALKSDHRNSKLVVGVASKAEY